MNAAEDILKQQIEECKNVWENFLYFLSAFVWIEDKERKTAIKLKLWPDQEMCIGDMVSCLLLVILKARQLGLTWLTAAYVLWRSIKHPLHLTVIISVNEDLSIEFLNRVYFILDRLPEWLYPPIKTRTKQILEFAHEDGLVSTIKSMPTTEMGAQSKTPNILVMDETCMNRMAGSIFNASLPGIEAAKGQVIIISNSIKTGPGWGWTRDLCNAALAKLNQFKLIFLSWTANPNRPADFRQRMMDAGMDEQDVIEHYPETTHEALSPLSGSYFGKTLERHIHTVPGVRGYLKLNKEKEVEFFEDPKGIVELWRHPYFLAKGWNGAYYERRYAIGDDVSEGLGESSSVAYVRDRLRDENVCRVRSNRLDAVEWAEQIDLLGQFYCNYEPDPRKVARPVKTLSCTEVTGAGQTVVKELIKRKCPQYVRIVPDVVGSGVTKQYGWHESNQSKHELCGDLKNWLRITKGRVYDALLIDECSTFIRMDNGKLDHEDGKRSDCVMAAGLTEQASIFMGEGPKAIPVPVTGWRARKLEEERKGTVWAN
ncbi:MAG: hypothetical protein WC294_06010 [Methanoregula sp.]|jgi:hypothetical protein